ncbi:uncharacterized protein METZ01_LOCUS103012 [marine metagenome]|uniref:Uncharacterized protein n=1 Tax=marine metagenome TaxID=408172 RepID=A0A381WDN6_9ZZZZ
MVVIGFAYTTQIELLIFQIPFRIS